MEIVFGMLKKNRCTDIQAVENKYPKPPIVCAKAPWYWPFHNMKLLENGDHGHYRASYGGGDHICLKCYVKNLKKSKHMAIDDVYRKHDEILDDINKALLVASKLEDFKKIVYGIQSSRDVALLHSNHDNLFIRHLSKVVIDENL
jgi:hypothetical protein